MDKQTPDEGSFWQGLFIGVFGNIFGISVGLVLAVSGHTAFLMAIGATQVIYLGPSAIYFYKTGKVNTTMGIAVIAGLTVLLNVTCQGLVARWGRWGG
jgi:hypothetical protein